MIAEQMFNVNGLELAGLIFVLAFGIYLLIFTDANPNRRTK